MAADDEACQELQGIRNRRDSWFREFPDQRAGRGKRGLAVPGTTAAPSCPIHHRLHLQKEDRDEGGAGQDKRVHFTVSLRYHEMELRGCYMSELQIAFTVRVPEEGFRWSDVNGPTRTELGDIVQDGDVRPPWLIGAPLGAQVPMRETHPLREEPALHRELALLPLGESRAFRDGVLRFANRYGTLTRGQLTLHIHQGEVPEIYRGESLFLWLREVQELKDTLELWNLAERAERDKEASVQLRELIVWDREGRTVCHRPGSAELWDKRDRLHEREQAFVNQRRRHARSEKGPTQPVDAVKAKITGMRSDLARELPQHGRAFLGEYVIAAEGHDDRFLPFWRSKRDLLGPARLRVAQVLSEKLAGNLQLGLQVDRPEGRLVTTLQPRDLRTALWTLFHQEVLGQRRLRQCLVCGSWFDATRTERRIYCSRRGSGCRQKASRLRKRARALENQGLPPERIAEEIGVGRALIEFLLDEKDAQEETPK